MTLPFGKYRGHSVDAVPAGYLAWLLEETDINEPHRSAIRDELAERLDLAPDSALQLAPPAGVADRVSALIAAGYRSIAPRLHPDRAGGDGRAMQEVNAARDWCRMAGLLR